MGIRIDQLQAAILAATADEANAKARVTALRQVLDTEARRRYAAEGAAPTWKSRLGAIRFDAPGEWAATVADETAFASYVAERHPEEATATITVAAGDLEAALTALTFAGLDPLESRVEVRPVYRTKYLEGLLVEVEEQTDPDGSVDRTIAVIDPATGELVDGVSATRANAAGRLVVTLDKDAKRKALDAAKAQADTVLAEVTGAQPIELVDGKRTDDAPHGSPTTMSLGEALATADPAAATTLLGEQARGREVTLDEVRAKLGDLIQPASSLTPAPALTAEEAATVARFDAAPDALEQPAPEDLATVEQLERQTRDAHNARALPGEHRIPYVGEGADGARRSAEIDRTEADTYDPGEDRDRCLASADRWDRQAAELEAATPEATTDEDLDPDAIAAGKVAAEQQRERLDGLTAEVLKGYAKAHGIPIGGRKADVIDRLVDAGATVADVNEHARRSHA